MRIGFGTRVGGVYVGASTSTKKIGQGIGTLILLPFYMVYYLCIWPFIAIYRACTKKSRGEKKRTLAEARVMAAQYAKHVEDSVKLVNTTKVPGVFFDRFDFMIESLSKLVEIEHLLPAQEEKPSAAKERILGSKADIVNAFIDRYAMETRLKIHELSTQKGRVNRAEAFRNILAEYVERMPQESIEYADKACEKIKALAS